MVIDSNSPLDTTPIPQDKLDFNGIDVFLPPTSSEECTVLEGMIPETEVNFNAVSGDCSDLESNSILDVTPVTHDLDIDDSQNIATDTSDDFGRSDVIDSPPTLTGDCADCPGISNNSYVQLAKELCPMDRS